MIRTGLDNFIANIYKFKNRKTALIANQTSVNSSLEYSWDVFKREGLKLKRIFSPEHGLFSTEQDQDAVTVEPDIDIETISLYGTSFQSLIPDKQYIEDIDLIIFDIQDIGSRYYTYVNTMALFMKEIHGRDVEFIVLDRPNPLGGTTVEGPLLNDKFKSFVGILPVPVRHGMTAGEIARLYKRDKKLDFKLTIMKMTGWDREMYFKNTGLEWIPPSPNMPSEQTACLYPGICLLEGTNISEGRGTTIPFQNTGAPFINPGKLTGHLNSYRLGGVVFRPVYFKPSFNKYADKICGGVYIHINDLKKFQPFLTGIAVIKAIHDLCRNEFQFLKGVYEFNDTYPAFDLLTGSSGIREMITGGKSLEEIADSWINDEELFLKAKKEVEIY